MPCLSLYEFDNFVGRVGCDFHFPIAALSSGDQSGTIVQLDGLGQQTQRSLSTYPSVEIERAERELPVGEDLVFVNGISSEFVATRQRMCKRINPRQRLLPGRQ